MAYSPPGISCVPTSPSGSNYVDRNILTRFRRMRGVSDGQVIVVTYWYVDELRGPILRTSVLVHHSSFFDRCTIGGRSPDIGDQDGVDILEGAGGGETWRDRVSRLWVSNVGHVVLLCACVTEW